MEKRERERKRKGEREREREREGETAFISSQKKVSQTTITSMRQY